MLDLFDNTFSIFVSILTLVGIGTGVYWTHKKVTKGNRQNNSGSGAINVVGDHNTIVSHKGKIIDCCEDESITNTRLKDICHVLFIDDEPLPNLISTLKKSGWPNVKRMGDTANIDHSNIQVADIIFVDILGVGKALNFHNEGIGLAAAIKRRYSQKAVIIYSATPEHNVFDPDLKIVDGLLSKNAEPIQFSNMIEQYAKPKN